MSIWRRILPALVDNHFFVTRKVGNIASGAANVSSDRIDRAAGLQPDTAISLAAQFCNTCKVVMIGLNAKKTQDVLREKAINGCSVIIPGLIPRPRWVGYLVLSFWLTVSLAGEINITSPAAGNFYQPGEEIDITWTDSGVGPYYVLEYSADNGTNWVRIPSSTTITTDQTISWTVPTTKPTDWPANWPNGSPASYSKFRISAVDTAPAPGASPALPLAQAERVFVVGQKITGRSLTIITHGYQFGGSLPGWPEAMAKQIVARAGGSGKIIRFNHDNADASIVSGNGEVTNLDPNGPTVIIYDWARVSNNLVGAVSDGDNTPATPGWREAAGDLLANFLLGSGLVREANLTGKVSGQPIVPVHFIAHSFGTVVASEAIRRLSFEGIDVDQFTTLDAHDFDQAEISDAKYYDPNNATETEKRWNEPQVAVWSNVRFADNYWEDVLGDRNDYTDNQGLFGFGALNSLPVGRPMAGSFEGQTTSFNHNLSDKVAFTLLDETIIAAGVIPAALTASAPHSRIWGWYFKTIAGRHYVPPLGSSLLESENPELDGRNWYQSGDPLTFGFALTDPTKRPGGTLVRQTPPTPSSIFNGDFELHIQNTTLGGFEELPGYVTFLGQLTTDVGGAQKRAGWLRHNSQINPAPDFLSLKHRPIWIPKECQSLDFKLYAQEYDGAGSLRVQVGALDPVWVNSAEISTRTSAWGTISISIPPASFPTDSDGIWAEVEISLTGYGSQPTSIYIDDISLVQPVPAFTGFTVNGMSSAILPEELVYLPATGDITLSTSATGGAVYQWFRKAAGTGTFVALVNDAFFSGVTDNLLTIKNPTSAYNGDEYRVEVRNTGGTATSNSIILTLGSDLTGDLIGDYRFEGNTNDYSGHGATGTANGGVTYGTGLNGQAIELNGTNGYIDLPNVILRPMTASAWVKLDSSATFSQVSTDPSIQTVAVIDGWKDRENFMLRIRKEANGTLRAMASFHDWVGPTNEGSFESYDELHIQSARNLKFGAWYHLAMTYDGTTLKLYVDGRLEASASRPTNKYPVYTAAVPDLRIGVHRFNDGYFKGAIDQVRLYTKALDANEILAIGGRNLLVNGSFEDQGGLFFQVGVGSNALAPWAVTAGNIDLTTGKPAAHGERLVDMDGFYEVGTLTQSFQAEPGEHYLLSFAMSGNDGNYTPKQVEVTVGDQIRTFTYEHSAVWGWEREFLTFVATATNQTLTIRSLSAAYSTFGAMLDDLVIVKLDPTDLVAPTIASQPNATTSSDSTSFTLSVVPNSVLPVYYQWRKDGGLIAGANSSELTLSNLDITNTGVYDVVVTNAAGSTNSQTVNRQILQASLVLQASPVDGGSLSGAGTYVVNSTQTISATPNAAWTFAGWSDGSMVNPRQVTLPAEGATYTANFSLVVPTAGAASEITTTSFQANWSALSGISGLRLDVATDAAFSNFLAGYSNRDINGNSSNEPVTGLNPGTTYYYRLRAYVPGAISENSAAITVTTTIPTAPVPFAQAASNVTLTSFQANWAGVSGAQGLRLDVASDVAFSNFVAGYNNRDINGNAYNEVVTGLNPGTDYYYRLRSYVLGDITSSNSNVITVSTGLSARQSWQQSKFTSSERLDANISGPNADPDGDGFSNLVEYALGLEPKAASTTGLPSTSVQGADWVYTYARPGDRTDLTYAVEYSTNLTSWSSAGVAHELVSSSGGTETWRGRYPLASAANVFFRLRVTGQ